MNKQASAFSNERSIANAGSGKTYALTNRFIALAFLCDVGTICALTFTRMAAGEFLDKIVSKLADAAFDDAKAKSLSEEIFALTQCVRPTRSDFLALLKKILNSLSSLQLSTIDAFQSKFTKAFASELGIVGDVRILDSFDAERLRRRVLDLMMAQAALRPNGVEDFERIVEEASMGRVQKMVVEKISDYVCAAHKLFVDFPHPERWGDLNLLQTKLQPARWDAEKYKIMFEDFSAEAAIDGSKSVSQLVTFFKNSSYGNVYSGGKFVGSLKDFIRQGGAVKDFVFSEKDKVRGFTPKEVELIDGMLNMLLGASWQGACSSARAVGQIVSDYEHIYREEARLKGRLSFDDLSTLLLDPKFSAERELVEFRFDSRMNHYLIDEFQDTSRAQWRTLENLADEILTSGNGERTFYFVGDVKQSIYGWRGGAPELFDEIPKKYKGAIRDGALLAQSRRSASPVINAVNALFSSDKLKEFNSSAAFRWLDSWNTHTAHPSTGNVGCVHLVERDESLLLAEQVYRIIAEACGNGRHFSCAVLVQRNAMARELAADLRMLLKKNPIGNISVSGELDSSLAEDNMVVCAILKLLSSVAHPSDTASLEYVKMTPLAPYVEGDSWRENLLKDISDNGFFECLRGIASFLNSVLDSADAFSRVKISQLADAASEFGGRGGIDEFLEFVSSFSLRESSKNSQVRVMTIHKSKGLDFDFVIMPQLENMRSSMENLRLRKIPAKDGGEVVVNLPSRSVCEFDEGFLSAYERQEKDLAFAKICNFYVGVTRAKKAVYFISKWFNSSKKSSAKYDFARHVFDTFYNEHKSSLLRGMSSCVALGDARWFEKVEFKEVELEQLTIPQIKNPRRVHFDFGVSASSRVEHAEFSREAMLIGTLIHSVLENLPDFDVDFSQALQTAISKVRFYDERVRARVERVLADALSRPDFAREFAVEAGCDIRREFPFVAEIGGEKISGVFDRLVIYRLGDRVERVRVVDFKTDFQGLSEDEIYKIYEPQMKIYREVASALFSLPADCVESKILVIRVK